MTGEPGHVGTVLLVAAVLFSGCVSRTEENPAATTPSTQQSEPLAFQQSRAYPETVTGRFVSLADFEDTPLGRGHEQLRHFTIDPLGSEGDTRFVVNITRTGIGALAVTLWPESELVFHIPDVHDFRDYSLLSMAVYSETLRDDFQVILDSDGDCWTSHRTLIQPGWNTVLIDIQRLSMAEGFAIRGVRRVRLRFAKAAGPVQFGLDDIMVIDNRRYLHPAPAGLTLYKAGLDYTLTIPGKPAPLEITQDTSGLWRLGADQPLMQLLDARPQRLPLGEQLQLMGNRCVGRVELLECNPVRIRMVNTWYFPTRSGEWISLAVRRIRWEYTFYSDGRWVTNVEVNNAGGGDIGWARLLLSDPVAWAENNISVEKIAEQTAAPVVRWSYLRSVSQTASDIQRQNFISPGKLIHTLPTQAHYTPGDRNRDGFDESHGCYFLTSTAGHCRFTIVPPEGGLLNPVFHIAGSWGNAVSVNCEGKPIRNVVCLSDGSAVFMLSGRISKPTHVEVTGKISASAAAKTQP